MIVDDASGETGLDRVGSEARFPVTLVRAPRRQGVARARNMGAANSRGQLLFFTDSHVEFSAHWDTVVIDSIAENRVLAGTVAAAESTDFKGYGCRLVVPYMGTNWERATPPGQTPVQIAVSVATALHRDLFFRIGGYDEGMILYGGAEPEFSVRAWLSGAEIVATPAVEIRHRFKSRPEIDIFVRSMRPFIMHNCLRFGMLYLNHPYTLTMLRYHANQFPRHFEEALNLLVASDVWERRAKLQAELAHDFEWFAQRFALRDQAGRLLLDPSLASIFHRAADDRGPGR